MDVNNIIKSLHSLYIHKEHFQLTQKIIEVLSTYGDRVIEEENIKELESLLKAIFAIIIKEDFVIPQIYARSFIFLSSVISNLTSITDLKNTDQYISLFPYKISVQTNTLIKLLALYSLRNEIKIDYNYFFSIAPDLSSYWYWHHFDNTFMMDDEISQLNAEKHLENVTIIGDRLLLPSRPDTPYFKATYIHPDNDRFVKEKINQLIKEKYATDRKFNNNTSRPEQSSLFPTRKKIAVLSNNLQNKHVIHRCLYEFIKTLSEDYDLTLITLDRWKTGTDIKIFKELRQIKLEKGRLDLSAIEKNEFVMAYYPDIGINAESIILSNLRIAPIQVVGYGHPVSTFGSEIDYYIAGYETESLAHIEENYSERVVLIPGLGMRSPYPTYERKYPAKKDNTFIISCPWTFVKINYYHLLTLKEILQGTNKQIKFRFFSGLFSNCVFSTFKKDLAVIFGEENFEVFPIKSSEAYIQLLEETDLMLNSYHYGGYNVIIDAMYLGKPVVTMEGTKAYNRMAGVLLRKHDLSELVAKDKTEYIHKVIELITNDNFRDSIIKKINKINTKKDFFDVEEVKYFKKAIDYLVNNHEYLKAQNTKKPIIIEES